MWPTAQSTRTYSHGPPQTQPTIVDRLHLILVSLTSLSKTRASKSSNVRIGARFFHNSMSVARLPG
jgi:hypothetical protein